MLKFKNQKVVDNKDLNIGIVVDRSSSMQGFEKRVVESLNSQLESFRKEAKSSGINTKVSMVTFASQVDLPMAIDRFPIENTGEIDIDSYLPNGMTALNSAIEYMMGRLSESKGMYLLLVITDGGENYSPTATHIIKQSISNALLTDLWTFAFCVPRGDKSSTCINYGVPEGCVVEWEQSSVGIQKMSNSIAVSNTSLYAAYSSGETRSKSYFQPDLNNLSQTVVSSNLQDVTDRFVLVTPTVKTPIRDFVESQGFKFVVGMNFYELSKKETVQDYKDIMIRHRTSNTIYTGDNARSLLRLPSGGTVELSPTSSSDYQIFVRSTSWNRNLVPGCSLLVDKSCVKTQATSQPKAWSSQKRLPNGRFA